MPSLWRWKQKSVKPTTPCVHRVAAHQARTNAVIVEQTSNTSDGPTLGTIQVRTEVKKDEATRDSEERCENCRKDKLRARRYLTKLIIGLFFPFALQALDLTIIASALPWIASDFNEISQMNWIISAFNLTLATFIPFSGQMADVFGRHVAMQGSLLFILVGSALCTGAPTDAFPVLILGRAIQGIGCAGVSVISDVIMADKVSLKEYSKNSSIFATIAGVSYALGPVIGGFLTNASWRWCFGINLPVGVLGIILVFIILRPELLGPQPLPELLAVTERSEQGELMQKFKARIATIDVGGQFLFLFGMGLLILALTWAGADYPWGSVQVIVPLALGLILTMGFILWQYMMVPGRVIARKLPFQRPTIPWEMIRQRNMGLLFYINFACGMAMVAVLYYVDIYLVLVKAFSPSKAGVQLLYYTPGIGIGVYLAMYMCMVYPAQTFHPLFLGSIIEALGVSILTWALHNGHIATIYGMMGLTGCGTGLRFMPGTMHGVGFYPNNIASVISMMTFAAPFGSTIAMTIMGTVFNNRSGMPKSSNLTSGSIGEISDLPTDIQKAVRDSAKDGIVWAFIAILPLMWLCVVAAALLGSVRIKKNETVDAEGGRDFSEDVEEDIYLVGWFRRKFVKGGQDEVRGSTADENRGNSRSNEGEGPGINLAEKVDVSTADRDIV